MGWILLNAHQDKFIDNFKIVKSYNSFSEIELEFKTNKMLKIIGKPETYDFRRKDLKIKEWNDNLIKEWNFEFTPDIDFLTYFIKNIRYLRENKFYNFKYYIVNKPNKFRPFFYLICEF